MRTVSFNREKFRELILYIAERTADDPSFGDTHLNKALYWTDVRGYNGLGRPVTGARYFKLQFGPAAVALLPVRDEMSDEGALEIDEPPSGTKQARRTRPRRRPNIDLFNEDELKLVNDVIEQVQGIPAWRLSEISHQEPGWRLVDMYDDIPYEAALIAKEPPPEATLARARARAAQLGW